jgi:Holliday junction resolvasome RuvABC endonuclease subunit
MSLLIAADLSLNSTGVVVMDLEKGSPVHYESITSDIDNIERLNYNFNRYKNLLSSYRDIRVISYEAQNQQMRFSYNAGSILNIAENVGVWKLAIYQSLVYYNILPTILSIPAQDIKKYATGNGQATKEDMIAAVNGNHIKSIKRDIPEHSINDVADAYHLAKMTRDLIINNKDYSKYLIKDYKVS